MPAIIELVDAFGEADAEFERGAAVPRGVRDRRDGRLGRRRHGPLADRGDAEVGAASQRRPGERRDQRRGDEQQDGRDEQERDDELDLRRGARGLLGQPAGLARPGLLGQGGQRPAGAAPRRSARAERLRERVDAATGRAPLEPVERAAGGTPSAIRRAVAPSSRGEHAGMAAADLGRARATA